jgi:predicted NAD/FAD-binding protein
VKIAIIGSGISGLSCAYLLNPLHDITLFEAAANIGGHTATIAIEHRGENYNIDTGFIVYNDWTYPNFIKLMTELGVESKKTEMSFSVSCKKTGLEYGGNNINTLFSQRKNLFNLKYWRMIKDIMRFNKEAIKDLDSGLLNDDISLGAYLQANNYGQYFITHYLIPMGSAIWSASLKDTLALPLLFFVRFFKNHGLLSVNNRPQWRVLTGGSQAYLKPLTNSFRKKIVTKSNIAAISRNGATATLLFSDGRQEIYDQVIFACHSNQALQLLSDPSEQEKQILAAIPYRDNEVILHTDTRLLPNIKKAWSSWNYHLHQDNDKPPVLSYNMNILQGINAPDTFIVSLNASHLIEPSKIISRHHYAHPCFSLKARHAQQQWGSINGVNNSWFCGAYWNNGFHEDGCSSGIRVAKALGASW